MITKDDLLKQNIELIPISDLNITFDSDKTIGYDLTVEDFFTFETSDGIFVQDTMAVYLPLSDEAQQEAKDKMMGAVTGDSSRSISFEISKEMCAGLYVLTKDVKIDKPAIYVNEKNLEEAKDPYIPVVFNGKHTTMGKAIFNNCLPKGHLFVNEQVNKKIANNLLVDIVEKYGDVIASDVASKLGKTGFKFATLVSPTFILEHLELPKEIYDLKKKLDGASIEEANELLQKMKKVLIEYLKGTGLYDLVDSGSTKGWEQPMQILVAKGIIADAAGNILAPIKGSYTDGLTPTEYFLASSGARKGIIDRVLNTATTGYLSRKLVYLLNSVEADPYLTDCNTKRTLDFKVDSDIMKKMSGRYILVGNKVEEFDSKKFKAGQVVHLRSPIYCESPKICHVCYGKLLMRHRTPYVGVIAAQGLGERATQLIMRSFHTGGAVKIAERNMLNDIVMNDPLITTEMITPLFEQQGNILRSKQDCKITIDLSYYSMGDNIIIADDGVWVKSLVAQIEFQDLIFNLILDYAIELKIEHIVRHGKESIELDYKKDNIVLESPMEAVEIKQQVAYVERLIGGREIVKDPDHLFRKLYDVYGPISDMDIVHMEVLLSQCLRDRSNPSLAARLGKTWDPVMVNIKKNIFSSGFLQGLGFENINEVIKTGLISDVELEPSIIEKLMTGTLVKKKEKEED